MSSHHRRSSFVRKALAVACLPAVLLSAACGSQGVDPAAQAGEPKSGGTLRVAQPIDPLNCIDPFQTNRASTRSLVRNIAESLVDQDPDTGEFKPWLASAYKVSDDGLTYTFDLKSGVTFSDGTPFNADAVVANFQDFLDPSHPVVAGALYMQGVSSVGKVDDDTVELHLSEPNSSLLQALATTSLAISSPAYLKAVPFAERCASGKVIGTGPFTLESFDPKTKTVLARRSGYTSPSPFSQNQGNAYLDKIEVNYVPESSVRIGSLNGGQIDVIWLENDVSFDENEIAQVKQGGNVVQSRSVPGLSYNLIPNVRHGGPLSDPKVRQAFSLGIDRATFAHTAYRADYPVVQSLFDTTTPGYQANPASAAYDPGKANQLLDEAGWVRQSDGYRYKDGKKLTVHYIYFTKSAGQELIQDELKQIGIDYQIDIVTNSELAARAASGDYDITTNTWTRADPNAVTILIKWNGAQLHVATNNKSEDEAAQADDIYAKAVHALSDKDRNAEYLKLQHLLEDNYNAIPIYERLQDAALAPTVHGLRFTADSFADYSGVWIE